MTSKLAKVYLAVENFSRFEKEICLSKLLVFKIRFFEEA